jgi:acyl-CoA thioester hydrolase
MDNHKIFTIDIDVRFRDIDAMGHVNNAVFFTYFEQGRVRFTHLNPQLGISFILAHVSCDYIRPVMLENQLTLRMWVNEIGTKSFGFRYELVDRSDDESVVYATGESVQVFFDYSKNVSKKIPKELRRSLSEYLPV